MKINSNHNRVLETGGVLESAEATLAGDAHIFEMLAKQYQRPEEAVLRETLCNAYDAQLEEGTQDTPTVVQLPNNLKPELRIRDFGTGLSKENTLKLFTCYGFSTKRENENAVGFFGIGSKSFFAVTSSATITSYYQGKQYVFSFYKNEVRKPIMSLLYEADTDEPNGLEISYPVPKDRIAAYTEAAKRIFPRLINRQKLKILGLGGMEVTPVKYTLTGTNWALRDNSSKWVGDTTGPAAIMGGVAYPISTQIMRSEFAGKPEINFTALPLDFEVPIGALMPVPSREGLEYDDTTRAYLVKLFKEFTLDFVKTYEAEIDKAETEWEAREKLYEITHSSNLGSEVTSGIWENAKWKGTHLKNTNWVLDILLKDRSQIKACYYSAFEMSWNEKLRPRWGAYFSGNCDGKCKFVIDDRKTNTPIAIKHSLITQPQCRVYVIKAENPEVLKEYLNKMGNPPVILSSSLSMPSSVDVDDSDGSVKKEVRLINAYRLSPNLWGHDMNHDVKLGGVYVNLYSRKVTLEKDYDSQPRDDEKKFSTLMRRCNSLELMKADDLIFGFSAAHKRVPAKNPNWVHFKDWIDQKIDKEAVKRIHGLYIRNEVHAALIDNRMVHFLDRLKGHNLKLGSPSVEKAYKTLRTFQDLVKNPSPLSQEDLLKFMEEFKISPPTDSKAADFEITCLELETRYPLIKRICANAPWIMDEGKDEVGGFVHHLLDYTRLIDTNGKETII